MTDGYKIKRVLTWVNNVEKQIYPAGWKPGSNLLAYYPLTSDANDHKGDIGYSGTMYNLSLQGTSPTYGTNGASNTSKYGLRNSSIPFSSSYTAMLWCKRTSYTTNGTHGPIALTEKFMGLSYGDNSYPQIGSYSWGGDGYIQTGVTMQNNQWYHLAWVMDSSKITIYINGTAYGPYNYRIGGTYNGLVVGGTYYQSTIQGFIGTIGEVYIWNRAITTQEVSQYYNQTKSNYGL